MDGRKINKRGGSNKGMADGFFCKINRRGDTIIQYLRVVNSSALQSGHPAVSADTYLLDKIEPTNLI